jgi:hypothetical protein
VIGVEHLHDSDRFKEAWQRYMEIEREALEERTSGKPARVIGSPLRESLERNWTG